MLSCNVFCYHCDVPLGSHEFEMTCAHSSGSVLRLFQLGCSRGFLLAALAEACLSKYCCKQ